MPLSDYCLRHDRIGTCWRPTSVRRLSERSPLIDARSRFGPAEGLGERFVHINRARDGIAILSIVRPERRNALNMAVKRELVDALTLCESDPGVSAIILPLTVQSTTRLLNRSTMTAR